MKKNAGKAGVIRDYSALTGIGVSIAAVAGGFAMGGGRILDLASLNALAIVAGGTMGAIFIGTPRSALMSALSSCKRTFRYKEDERQAMADRIVRLAAQVRRGGARAIEQEVESMAHGFARRALLLAVDEVPSAEIRRQMETDIASEEEKAETDARVFEQAGGYAPTIGIMGAVLGLIQVMKHLGNADAVGRGIAAAFVSTLYGVGIANLVLLPLAARIRAQAQAESRMRELVLEGVTAIAEGLSLHVVRSRLETWAGRGRSANAMRNIAVVPAAARTRRIA